MLKALEIGTLPLGFIPSAAILSGSLISSFFSNIDIRNFLKEKGNNYLFSNDQRNRITIRYNRAIEANKDISISIPKIFFKGTRDGSFWNLFEYSEARLSNMYVAIELV